MHQKAKDFYSITNTSKVKSSKLSSKSYLNDRNSQQPLTAKRHMTLDLLQTLLKMLMLIYIEVSNGSQVRAK